MILPYHVQMPPLFFWSIASISFFTYTLLCYQTIRIFARACSGKDLLLYDFLMKRKLL